MQSLDTAPQAHDTRDPGRGRLLASPRGQAPLPAPPGQPAPACSSGHSIPGSSWPQGPLGLQATQPRNRMLQGSCGLVFAQKGTQCPGKYGGEGDPAVLGWGGCGWGQGVHSKPPWPEGP